MSGDRYLANYRGEVIDDNDPLQEGRVKVYVFGVYDDIPEDSIPWALYSDPFMGGQQELGGFFVPDVGSHVWVFFEMGDPEQPVYFAGAPARGDGPSEAREKGQYPRNKVFKTMGGHTVELDDSPGETRIRIAHNSGTQKIYADNGDAEEHIIGNLNIVVEQDANIYVKGDVSETVEGNVIRTVRGDVTEVVQGSLKQSISGDHTTSIMGRRKEMSGGGTEHHTSSNMEITGSRIDLNKGGGAAVEIIDGEFYYTLEYAYTYGAAKGVVEVAGPNAPFDDEGSPEPSDEFPEDETIDRDPEEHEPEDKETQVIEDGCPVVSSDKYATPIGNAGKTVRDMTLGPVFPHPLQAQNGLSEEELICNGHHLMLNAVDPLLARFPELRINSGFRRGSGSSQHNVFAACDLQSRTRPGDAAFYKEVLDFIAANIPYDQCIIESSQASRAGQSGVTYWIHISYDRNKATQRKERLTYFGKRSPKYTSGWGL